VAVGCGDVDDDPVAARGREGDVFAGDAVLGDRGAGADERVGEPVSAYLRRPVAEKD
jgi:hypothetical protein